jgi:hypothetical protein
MNHFPSRTMRAVKVAAVFMRAMCIQRLLAASLDSQADRLVVWL